MSQSRFRSVAEHSMGFGLAGLAASLATLAPGKGWGP